MQGGPTSAVKVPDLLLTSQQLFGRNPEDELLDIGDQAKSKKVRAVTPMTFWSIEQQLLNFILARFMVYKWLNPFSEMYVRMQQ